MTPPKDPPHPHKPTHGTDTGGTNDGSKRATKTAEDASESSHGKPTPNQGGEVKAQPKSDR